jgi:TonB family protein
MYPETARNARVEGVVKLWFVVDAGGEVIETGIISGNPLLRDAAANAVKSWRFQPNILQPKIRFDTEFVYVLNIQSKEGEPQLTVSMTDFRRVEVTSELYVKPIE